MDELALTAPSRLADGETGEISATVQQDGTRSVPVAWPMAADWDGDHRVHVGDPDHAWWWDTVAVDPATGTVTALRPHREDLRDRQRCDGNAGDHRYEVAHLPSL